MLNTPNSRVPLLKPAIGVLPRSIACPGSMADISVVPGFCPSLIGGMVAGVMRAGSNPLRRSIVPNPSSKREPVEASIGA